jgi:hypothetical protein
MQINSALRIPHSAFLQSSILNPRSSAIDLWAVWWHADGEDDWFERLTWAPWAVAKEVGRGFAYIIWLPALLGLRWFHRAGRNNPSTWILGVLCLFQAILLCRVGLVVGYVSERHVLIIVLCGLYWAIWAILQMVRSWGNQKSEIRSTNSETNSNNPMSNPNPGHLRRFNHWSLGLRISDLGFRNLSKVKARAWAALIILALMLACMPMTLQPLHANQVGHREAGLWLALNSHPEDTIVDPFNWAYFYAGRVFEEGTSPPALPDHPATRFVVLELSRKPHAGLTWLPLAKQLAEGGEVVYDWKPDRHQLKHKAQEVQIFAVPVSSQ